MRFFGNSMAQSHFRPSYLEVICGPMFCGKSADLIARLNKFDHTDHTYQVFKPSTDTRVGAVVASRRGDLSIPATVVDDSDIADFYAKLNPDAHIIAFDETQFFGPNYLRVIEDLRREGKYIIAAGLDLDFMGEGFGIMPELAIRANHVTKLVAVCKHEDDDGKECQAEATHSIKLIYGNPAIYEDKKVTQVEDENASWTYSPRCIEHHIVPGRPTSR